MKILRPFPPKSIRDLEVLLPNDVTYKRSPLIRSIRNTFGMLREAVLVKSSV